MTRQEKETGGKGDGILFAVLSTDSGASLLNTTSLPGSLLAFPALWLEAPDSNQQPRTFFAALQHFWVQKTPLKYFELDE